MFIICIYIIQTILLPLYKFAEVFFAKIDFFTFALSKNRTHIFIFSKIRLLHRSFAKQKIGAIPRPDLPCSLNQFSLVSFHLFHCRSISIRTDSILAVSNSLCIMPIPSAGSIIPEQSGS